MKNKYQIAITFAAFLLLSMQAIPTLAYGVEVWSDDFDDSTNDGWTVHTGQFSSATSDELRAVATGWSTASHASDVSCGHWYFDLEENQTSPTDQHVFFIALSTDPASMDGYSLFVDIETTSYIRLYKWISGTPTMLDEIERPAGTWGWYHYNVTRDEVGYFEVHREDVTILTVTDTTYASSTYFVYHAQEGRAIDNISVWTFGCTTTTTSTTSTTTTTTTTNGNGDATTFEITDVLVIALVSGGALVVIIIVIIWLRKR
jgi:hypothetical protein